MKEYRVAIVGATGLVGQEFIRTLEQREFPVSSLTLLASERSAGKKMTAIVTMLFWLITQFGWVILKPDHPSYWVFIVGAIVGLGWGAAHVMPWAMFPDVMDQDEINTGERRERIYSGIMTFLMKMGNALAMFLIGLTLQAVNYVPNVPQTGKALEAMRLIMCFGPIVFIVIALAAAFFYPITTERYTEIRAELEKTRKERGA